MEYNRAAYKFYAAVRIRGKPAEAFIGSFAIILKGHFPIYWKVPRSGNTALMTLSFLKRTFFTLRKVLRSRKKRFIKWHFSFYSDPKF